MGLLFCRREFFIATASGLYLAAGLRGANALLAGKQIRLVVPFPAGGPTDIVARPFAQLLGDTLKSTVIVDNRGGAGGSIATDAVAKSDPDGLTLIMGTVGTHAINKALYAKLPYDPAADFTPIALVAMAPVAVVVHPGQPIKTIADLVALAKTKPGILNYGSAGSGTPGHLTAEMFKAASGININHIPYKGSAPAVTDLVSGQIQIMFDPLQSVLSNVQGDNLRAIAVSSKTRSPVLPNVSTIAESGYDSFETSAWWGLFAPAGLSPELTLTLTNAAQQVTQSTEFRSKLEPLGVLGASLTGNAFGEFQRKEIVKWGNAVRASGISVQ